MKRKNTDHTLEKYPDLRKFLDQTDKRYDLNSEEDLMQLFIIVLKKINDKRMQKKKEGQ